MPWKALKTLGREYIFSRIIAVGKPGPKLRIVTSPLLNSSHRESSTSLELSNASSAWDKGHLRESGRWPQCNYDFVRVRRHSIRIHTALAGVWTSNPYRVQHNYKMLWKTKKWDSIIVYVYEIIIELTRRFYAAVWKSYEGLNFHRLLLILLLCENLWAVPP